MDEAKKCSIIENLFRKLIENLLEPESSSAVYDQFALGHLVLALRVADKARIPIETYEVSLHPDMYILHYTVCGYYTIHRYEYPRMSLHNIICLTSTSETTP